MLLLLALGPALAASAAPAPQARSITLERFVSARVTRFLAADADKDGRVSLAEWTAARSGARGDPARQFAAIDADKDGSVTAAEIEAFASARFARLDANGDKLLTRDEVAGANAKGRTPEAM
jgi:hypothetical protein